MDTHGKFITEVQAQALIDKMDQKHDGVIDYNEFLLVVARKILTSKLNLDWKTTGRPVYALKPSAHSVLSTHVECDSKFWTFIYYALE